MAKKALIPTRQIGPHVCSKCLKVCNVKSIGDIHAHYDLPPPYDMVCPICFGRMLEMFCGALTPLKLGRTKSSTVGTMPKPDPSHAADAISTVMANISAPPNDWFSASNWGVNEGKVELSGITDTPVNKK